MKLGDTDPMGAESARLNTRAAALMDSGKPAKAADLLRKALCINPGSGLLRLNLAGALRKSGEPARALDVLDTIRPGTATAADARVLEGLIHFEAGRPDRAETSYLAAISAEPRHKDAWNDLGVLRFTAGRFKDAKDCFERALESDPGLADAWYNLADACRELGDEAGAAAADERYAVLSRRR